MLSLLTHFLSNRSQRALVDGCRSKLGNVSGVPQGHVLGQLLFLIHTAGHFYILENKLIDCADDYTLTVALPEPSPRQG